MSEVVGVEFETFDIRPLREHLFGATAAQSDLGVLAEFLQKQGDRKIIVRFDFSAAQSISGSYTRASLGWCLNCGKAFAEGRNQVPLSDPWSVRPLPIYAVVTGGSAEVLFEIHDFLQYREMCALLVSPEETPPFGQVEILGRLDRFLIDTLKSVAALGSASAQDLKDQSSEAITIGGWSNRLAALLSYRLVSRKRDGKSWKYSAIGKEFRIWD